MLLRREHVVISALVVIATFSWWWLSRHEPAKTDLALVAQEELDGYLNDFIATTMDDQGKPNHRLEADRMVLYTGTKLSQVDNPFLTLYQENKNPWLIRAEYGLVQTEQDIVFLTGNVRMTHEDKKGYMTEILTEQLEVQTKKQYAQTEHEVVVNDHSGFLAGKGMQAFLDEGQLTLLEEVRSRYDGVRH